MAQAFYAEDVSYWKTSSSSADSWLDKTVKLIKAAGGRVLTEGFIRESGTGRAAFLIEFLLQDNHFKLIWHVLKSRAGDEKAAKVQAATAMYHDVKAKCLRSIWAGARAAFLEWLLLPNGQTAAEAVSPDLLAAIPALISPRMGLLPGSDVVDGEYRVTAG